MTMTPEQRAERIREIIVRNPKQYLLIGDIDIPIHHPTCGCELCERWREQMGRPRREELRRGVSGGD